MTIVCSGQSTPLSKSSDTDTKPSRAAVDLIKQQLESEEFGLFLSELEKEDEAWAPVDSHLRKTLVIAVDSHLRHFPQSFPFFFQRILLLLPE